MKITNPLLLVAYVLISSVLGLGGVFTLRGGLVAVPAIVAVAWLVQPVADLTFVIGSMGVAVFSYRLCWRSPWLATLAAAAGSCLVYAVSASLVASTLSPGRDGTGPGTDFQNAIIYGLFGLAFATAAPVLLRLRRSR